MRHFRLSVLALILALPPAALASPYVSCVVDAVTKARKASHCRFDDLQTLIRGAHNACRPILMDLAMLGDIKQAGQLAQEWRAQADALVEARLNAEVKSCGYQGKITVGNGGLNLTVILSK